MVYCRFSRMHWQAEGPRSSYSHQPWLPFRLSSGLEGMQLLGALCVALSRLRKPVVGPVVTDLQERALPVRNRRNVLFSLGWCNWPSCWNVWTCLQGVAVGEVLRWSLRPTPLTPLFALFQTFCCLLECSGKQACKALGVFAANW
jgi:hypothetical protein